MPKAIVIAMIASLLFVFPIAYCICQTAEAGCGEEITVSQRLVAQDNSIVDADIVQVSVIRTGNVNAGGSSGGNSDDESGENSGGDSDEGSSSGDGPGEGNDAEPGGGSNNDRPGGGGESRGAPEDDSNGSPGGGIGEAEAMIAGQLSGNLAEAVVINEVHPRTEGAFERRDEMVELYNMGRDPVNVSLWYMKNMTGHVIGTIRDKEILPYGFLAVGVIGLTGDCQRVTLFDSRDNKIDSVIYIGARSHNGSCYARIPDGANIWEWAKCTLGSSNQQRYPG